MTDGPPTGADGPKTGADGPKTGADEPPTIRQLDDRTVQQIAAGEVVERPASVVKELVENSLDAGADRISVSIRAGGAEAIRVHDDGVGIPREQLPEAVAEHATSKIGDVDDLAGGVATLGFRGEALHAIGAVSRLTVRSRPRDDEVGAELTVEGGDAGEVRPVGCPEGTTVEVRDLFFNTPARKKFLATETTETDRVGTVVTQYALANPGVAVSFEVDDRERFATPGDGNLRSAVLSIYGRDVAEGMIEVEFDADDAGLDTPVDRVYGLISEPEVNRATREYLATFVNDRYVTVSDLRNAVLSAYGGQLAPERYPFAVLFVELPTVAVDANVHPRKLEVRFDEPEAVQSAVETAVSDALLDHGILRSSAPRGRSSPAETPVSPEETAVSAEAPNEAAEFDEAAADIDEGPGDLSEVGAESTAETDVDVDDVTEDVGAVDGDAAAAAADSAGTGEDTEDAADSTATGDATDAADVDSGAGTGDTRSVSPMDEEGWTVDGIDRSAAAGIADRGSGSSIAPDENARRTIDGTFEASEPTSQRTLSGGTTDTERAYESLPKLSILGQLFDTYVLAAADDGLVLIDQHAADERINYERLREAFADGPPAQALAEPVELELTAREATLLDAEGADDRLDEFGFEADRVDDRTVEVSSVPAVFDAALDPELLRDVLVGFARADADAGESVLDAVDDLLADLACYPSVTGNTGLTDGSIVELLSALDGCENPYACPHGRPTVIELSREEIEDRFERDYPGHAGRRAE